MYTYGVNLGDAVVGALIELLFGVLSILAVLWLESHRRPRLRFSIGAPGEIRESDPLRREPAKWTTLVVRNETMPRWLAWAFNRNPAMACRAAVEFFNSDGSRALEGSMAGRWKDNPEPVVYEADGAAHIDWDRMRIGDLYDIPSGEEARLDVVFRAKADQECYGWNNESYLHGWRNPRWRLPAGRYLARVTLRTGGETFHHEVEIANDLPYEQFDIRASTRRF